MANKFVTTQSVYQPKRNPQKFNEKATWIRQGKKVVIQDFINENATGLNFYENLERLGSVENTISYMKHNGQEIYDYNCNFKRTNILCCRAFFGHHKDILIFENGASW